MASRRALTIGAMFLIVLSFLGKQYPLNDPKCKIFYHTFYSILWISFNLTGKLGAILASIPQALAASVLCFIWALTVALGLSNLRYTQTASFRNITIVGVSLFLGLSIPAYFQQYQPLSSLILPSYYLPFGAASSGPFQTGIEQVSHFPFIALISIFLDNERLTHFLCKLQLDFAMNAVLSLNMVVTFLLAFVLDNTVPGSKEERGVYVWTRVEDMEMDPEMQADYSLPRKFAQICGCRCCWSRCFSSNFSFSIAYPHVLSIYGRRRL